MVLALVVALLNASVAEASVDLRSRESWVAVMYGVGQDPSGDSQAGAADTDIVGDPAHGSLYVAFNDNGTASTVDDTLCFRLRIDNPSGSASFEGVAVVGIDANCDGRIDLFITVDGRKSRQVVQLMEPGTGLNDSPSTTTTAPLPTGWLPNNGVYPIDTNNFSVVSVNQGSDPHWNEDNDLGNDGKVDAFVTWQIPMADLAAVLAMPSPVDRYGVYGPRGPTGIKGFTKDTLVRYIAFTQTQPGPINGDIDGIGASYDKNATYASLGAITPPMSPSQPVPAGPRLTITQPIYGGWLNATQSQSVSISGTSTYLAGQTLKLTVTDGSTTNSGSTTIGTDGTWTVSGLNLSSLSDGTLTVTATANDLSALATVLHDQVPPVITINTLAGSTLGTPTFSGTSDLPDGALLTVVVDADNNPTTADIFYQVAVSGGLWSLNTSDVPPISGTVPSKGFTSYAKVTVSGSDVAGNITIATLLNRPTVNGLTTNNTRPVLSGTWTKLTGDTLTVSVSGATYALTPSSSTWALDLASATPSSGSLTPLAGGNTYSVVATVKRGSASVNDTNVNELVITTAPIRLVSINGGATVTTNTPFPVISGTSQNSGGYVIVRLYPNNGEDPSEMVTYSVSTNGVGDWVLDTTSATPVSGIRPSAGFMGTNIVVATDSAGAVSANQILIVTIPTISIGSILSAATANSFGLVSNTGTGTNWLDLTEAANVTISGSATPGYAVNVTVTDTNGLVLATNGLSVAGNGSWQATTLNLASLNDGVLMVVATLSETTVSVTNTTVRLDKAAPRIFITTASTIQKSQATIYGSSELTNTVLKLMIYDTTNHGTLIFSNIIMTSASGSWATNTPSGVGLVSGNSGYVDIEVEPFATTTDVAGNIVQRVIRPTQFVQNTSVNNDTISIGTIAGDDIITFAEIPGGIQITGVTSLTTASTNAFTVTATDGTVTNTIAVTNCTSGNWKGYLSAAQVLQFKTGPITVYASVVDTAKAVSFYAVRLISLDLSNPTLTITDNAPITATNATTFTFTFSEVVTGFVSSHILVSGGTAGAFSGSGTTYNLVVAPLPSSIGTMRVTVTNGAAYSQSTARPIVGATASRAYNTTSSGAPPSLSIDTTGLATNGTPVISGTSSLQPGASVVIAIDLNNAGQTNLLCSATVQNGGAWRVDVSSATPTSGNLPVEGLPPYAKVTATGQNAYGISTTVVGLNVPTVTTQITNRVTPTVTGTWTQVSGDGLMVTLSNVVYSVTNGNLMVGPTNWSFTVDAGHALTDGYYEAVAKVTRSGSTPLSDLTTNELLIDTQASITISGGTTNTTGNPTPPLAGTSSGLPVGTVVTVSLDTDGDSTGDLVYRTPLALGGSWSLNTSTAVPISGTMSANGLAGLVTVIVTASDPAGNVATATQVLVVDVTPPSLGFTFNGRTDDTTPLLTGTSDLPIGSTVTVQVDPNNDGNYADAYTYLATVQANGNWSVQVTDTLGGTVGVKAFASDAMGNTSTITQPLTIDLACPVLSVARPLDAGGNDVLDASEDTAVLIHGTSANVPVGSIVRVVVTDGSSSICDSAIVSSDGSWGLSALNLRSLMNGLITVTATYVDDLGNSFGDTATVTHDKSGSITIDGITLDTGLLGDFITGDATLVFFGTAPTNSSMTLTLTGSSGTVFNTNILAGSSGVWSLNRTNWPLAAGTYTLQASGGTVVSQQIVINTAAPLGPATVVSQTTNSATPIVTGTASLAVGESLKVTVNGVTYAQGDGHLSLVGTTWTLGIPADNALSPASVGGGFNGAYTVTAALWDVAGNSLTATGTLTIQDIVAPVIDLDPSAAGSGNGATLDCNVTWTPGATVSMNDDTDPATVVESSDILVNIKIAVSGLADGAAEKLSLDGTLVSADGSGGIQNDLLVGGVELNVIPIAGGLMLQKYNYSPFTAAEAQSVIRGLKYQNTSGTPTAGARTFGFTATDGASNVSATATSTLTMSLLLPQASLVFNPPATQVYNTTNTLTVSGGSGSGSFSYTVMSGPGVIVNGNELWVTNGTGEVVVRATKAEDSQYASASTTATVSAAKAGQTITFAAIADQNVTSTVSLSASASSGLAVTFGVDSGPATLSGNQLSFTGTGPVRVWAGQEGDSNYLAAVSVTNSFQVSASPQAPLVFNPAATQVYNTTNTLSASGGSGSGSFSYTVMSGPGVIVNGNELWVTNGTGDVVVRVTKAGDSQYASASTTATVSAAKASQTITFAGIADQNATSTVNLSASASSGLAVSFGVDSGPATLSGNQLSFSGTGTVRVWAGREGDSNYLAAASVTNSFQVNASSQAPLVFNPAATQVYDTTNSLSASGGSGGGSFSYIVISGPGLIVNGNELWVTNGTGDVVVRATKAGDSQYASASTTATVSAAKAGQAITFAAIPGQNATSTVNLSASASSGLAVTFGVDSGPATLSGNQLSFTGTGTVKVWAGQEGDSNYLAAVSVTNSFQVNASTQAPLVFNPAATQVYNSTNTLSASGGSGSGTFTYTVESGPGVIVNGNELWVTNGTGDIVVSATKAGDALYSARTVTATVSAAKASQTITFAAIADQNVTSTVSLSASASSGLAVSFGVDSGPATLSGNQLSFSGTGPVKVWAGQEGDSNYLAAASVTNSFQVNASAQASLVFNPAATQVFNTTNTLTASGGSGSGSCSYTVVSGPGLIVNGNGLWVTNGTGDVVVRVTKAGDSQYASASTTATVSAAKAGQTITFTAIADQNATSTVNLSASASSGLAVTFGVDSGPATLSGNQLSFTGTGTVKVWAGQEGDSNSLAAVSVTNSFQVIASTQAPLVFNPAATQVFNTTNTLAASGGSGSGTFTYTVESGPGVIVNGNELWVTNGTGDVVVRATKAGDSQYASASTTATVSAAKAGQTITFAAIADQNAAGTVNLGASASSGLAVSFGVDSGPATLSGNQLTFSGTGTVKVWAGQEGDSNSLAAVSVTNSFQVIASTQAPLAFNPAATQVYNTTNTLTASGGSGSGSFSYTVMSGPGLIVNGNELWVTNGTGDVVVRATKAGDSQYASASTTATVSAAKASQTITFAAIADQNATSTVNLSASASSGLAVTFGVDSGPATLSGNQLSFSGTGPVKVWAGQEGDSNYLAAVSVTNSFQVNAGTQAPLVFNPAATQVFNTTNTLTASGGSGSGSFSYTVMSGPGLIVNGNELWVTNGTGDVVVRAAKAGDSQYASASTTATVSAAKASQTITFAAIADQNAAGTVNLGASASSGLAVSFGVDSGPATLSGNQLSFTGTGTVKVWAGQEGDSDYLAAASVTNSFQVSASPQAPLVFNPAATQVYNTTNTLSASGGSGSGSFSYTVISGPGVIVNGNELWVTNGTGDVVVRVTKAGDSQYASASTTATVSAAKAGQTITFTAIADQNATSTVNLSASASSGLAVTFGVDSGPATLSGNQLSFTGTGPVKVWAGQEGDSNYLVAVSVTNSFQVSASPQAPLVFNPAATQVFNTTNTLAASGGSGSGTFTYTVESGPGVIVNGNELWVTNGTGDIVVSATKAGDALYSARTVTATVSAAKAGQTITFAAIADQNATSTVNLGASASSGLAVSFAVVSGPAALNGSQLTFSGTGQVKVAAIQSGDSNYLAATSVTNSFQVNSSAQASLVFNPAATQVFNTTNTLTASGGSGSGTFTYTVESGPGSIVNGNELWVTNGTGDIVVSATKAGDVLYSARTVTATVSAAKVGQTIAFAAIADQNPTSAVSLSASASSGLAVSFAVVSGPAALNGSQLTFSGTGLVKVAAIQSGDSNYLAAANVTNSFQVNTSAQAPLVFNPPATQLYNTTNTLSASGGSGSGSFSYMVVNGPGLIVDGNRLWVTSGTGDIVVRVTKAGDGQYAPASATATVRAAKAGQTIAFGAIPNQSATSTLSLGAYASSGLAASFTLMSGPATLIGNQLTFSGTGLVKVAANQSGNSNYLAAASVTNSFQVIASTQAPLAFNPPATQVYNTTNLLTASGGSGSGTFTYTVVSGPGLIVNGNGLWVTNGTGDIVVSATKAGDALYNARTATATVSAAKAEQLITFAAIADQNVTSSVSLSATASSGLAVSFGVDSGPATLSGNQLGFTGTGTVKVWAKQEGDSNYLAAANVTNSFQVTTSAQAPLVFNPAATQVYNTTNLLTASGGSGSGTFTYTVESGPGVIVNGNGLWVTNGTGEVVVRVTKAGDSQYASASTTATVSAAKADQTITFATIADQNVTSSVSLSATASSRLAVSFGVDSGPATLTGNQLSFTGTGMVKVWAKQEGDSNYLAAASVTNSFQVTTSAQAPLVFNPAATQVYNTTNTLSASGGSGSGTFTYTVESGPGVIVNGNELWVTNGTGDVVVRVTKAGDSQHAPASATATVTAAKADQTITFATIADQNATSTVSLSASASSGLAVSYGEDSGPATLTGNQLSFTGTGTVRIWAKQDGNSNYLAAANVTNSFQVSASTQAPLVFSPAATQVYNTTNLLTASGGSGSGTFTYTVVSGPGLIVNGNELWVTNGTGDVVVSATKAGDVLYSARVVTATVSATKAGQTITFAAIADQNVTSTVNLSATASSGLAVSFGVDSGPTTLSGNQLTFSGTGPVKVWAGQEGDSNYLAAASVTNSLQVNTSTQAPLVFNPAATQVFNTTNTLTASGGSGSGVFTYTVVRGPGLIVNGNGLWVTNGTGDIVVSATKAGDALYSARVVTATVSAAKAASGLVLSSSINPAGFRDSVTVVASVVGGTGTVLFRTNGVEVGPGRDVSGGSITFQLNCLPRGTNLVTALFSGDANYLGATNQLTEVVTNHPPESAVLTCYRRGLARWKISAALMTANLSDPDGDNLEISEAGTSTNGIKLVLFGGYLQYYSTNLVDDQFTCTVSDGHGGSSRFAVNLLAGSEPWVSGRIEAVQYHPGKSVLKIVSTANRRYRLERSTDFILWTTVREADAPVSGLLEIEDTNAPPSAAFYRVLWMGN